MQITYARTGDSLDVTNHGAAWSGIAPGEDPTRLWLRVPDTEQGYMRLCEYDWQGDVWQDVTPS